MSDASEADIARELTGLCTYLFQGPEFAADDEVRLVCKRDEGGVTDPSWLPLTALTGADRESLTSGEAGWGREVVLVGARLAATGGQPRDSMNQPADDYDPAALTLADVRVLDRAGP